MATSQASLLRVLVPRLGERRAALLGIAVAAAGYLGYATAELQGAVACLYSLSSIVGPPLMSQLFGRFAAPEAPIYLPGAAFLAAAALATACLAIYWFATREPEPSVAEAASTAVSARIPRS